MFKKIVCVLTVFLLLFSFSFVTFAETVDTDDYIVYTDDFGSIFGDGHVAFFQDENDSGSVYTLPIANISSGFLQSPFFASGLKDSTKTAKIVVAQPTWVLDMGIFNGNKKYIFDFYIGVLSQGSNAFQSLKRFRFHFGNYNNKYYEPIEFIYASGSNTVGYAHFRFVVDGQVLINNKDYCTFEFLDYNSKYSISFGLPKNTEHYGNFIIKEYTEAEQIMDKEEEKGNSTGNSAIDGLTDALPNETNAFLPSIQNFVESFSYDGITAKWSIPQVYIPKIPNVIDKTVLFDDLQVDFNYWINKIPSGILKFVQALSTMALIVYCVKELYSLISYALTLKGGGDTDG